MNLLRDSHGVSRLWWVGAQRSSVRNFGSFGQLHAFLGDRLTERVKSDSTPFLAFLNYRS